MPNTYGLSDGTRLKKSVIDARIRKAKQEYTDNIFHVYGNNYCEALGHNVFDEPIDCSHIISVKRCQEMGKSELAYDLGNLQRESRSQHNIHENGSIEEKLKQLNFIHKCEYIAEHDPERFVPLSLAVKSVDPKLSNNHQIFRK